MHFLITGGAGFIGHSLALAIKRGMADSQVTCIDNMSRAGSRFRARLLTEAGCRVVTADASTLEAYKSVSHPDVVIMCAARPAITAGSQNDLLEAARDTIGTTIAAANHALVHSARLLFFSTSRVYSIAHLRSLAITEQPSRFQITSRASDVGFSSDGIVESFPTLSPRSLYGTMKFSSEEILTEIAHNHGLSLTILRCGVIAGPWQLGTSEQGFVAHWVISALLNRPVTFRGWGGSGRQVRDILHIDDCCDLVINILNAAPAKKLEVFNAGGGLVNSASLLELTDVVDDRMGSAPPVSTSSSTHLYDIPWYVSDNSRVCRHHEWQPKRSIANTLDDIARWAEKNMDEIVQNSEFG